MKLLVFSHKELWRDSNSPSGYVTIGGFPFQMEALANLFDETLIMATEHHTPVPAGAIPLTGKNLRVNALPAPTGADFRRKLDMLFWLPRHLRRMWQAARAADVIHTPVGGDVGTLGIFIALLQKKRLFVRHCGTWGAAASPIDFWLQRFLEKISGGRNVTLATGGGEQRPSVKNKNIQWIFSTSLKQAELAQLPVAKIWQPAEPLRLITTGRLARAKNIQSIIRALPLIKQFIPRVRLDILGDGEYRAELEAVTASLNLRDDIKFHGNVNHQAVMTHLAQAHLFIFPTEREGFPKSLLEALACGLPVIATRASVIPQLLRQGGGLLLENPNEKTIAAAVRDMTQNPTIISEMGAAARHSAAGYTLEAWGKTIGGILESAWGDLKTQ